MNRLMKAENYRLLNSGHLYAYIIILNLCAVGMLFVFSPEEIMGAKLYDCLPMMGEGIIFFTLILGMLATVMPAMAYQSKIGFYEVMSGHKVSHIINNKVIVDTLHIAGMLMVFLSGALSFLAVKNGVGTGKNLSLRLLLVVIVMLHISVSGVLLSMCFRHVYAGVFAYFRFGTFDMVLLMMIQLIFDNEDISAKVLKWTVDGQLQLVLSGASNKDIIVPIILSTIIECGFLYMIAYITMKKKLYR